MGANAVNAPVPFAVFPDRRMCVHARSFSFACAFPAAAAGGSDCGGRKDVEARLLRPVGARCRENALSEWLVDAFCPAMDSPPPYPAAVDAHVLSGIVTTAAASSRSPSPSRAPGEGADAGAVAAVSVPPADAGDKVPLTAAEGVPAATDPLADPENPTAPADGDGDADGDAEDDTWEDEYEELGSCSRSPWCHAVVYSILIAIVTFFILLFRQRFQ